MTRPVLEVSPDHPGCFPTIWAALEEAPLHAEIVVHPGLYGEQIHVTRSVTIRARDGRGSVRVHAPEGCALVNDAEDATVRGLVLSDGTSGATVWVRRGRLRLEECELPGPAIGVLAEPGSRPMLQRCQISSPTVCGVKLVRSDAVIEDCVVLDARTGEFGPANGLQAEGGRHYVAGFAVRGADGHGIRLSGGAAGRFDDVEVVGASRAGHLIPAVWIGEGANPSFNRLAVLDTNGHGVWTQSAGGVYEDCTLAGMGESASGFGVSDGADPVVRRMRVSAVNGEGFYLGAASRGTFEDCEVFASRVVGFYAGPGSSPAVRGLTVRDSSGAGIKIDNAGGVFENCTVTKISGEEAWGVLLVTGAAPTVRGLTVRDSSATGVTVMSGAGGEFEDVTVAGAQRCVMVWERARPVMRRLRLSGFEQAGLWVNEGAAGHYDDVVLTGPGGKVGVLVSEGGDPVLENIVITDAEAGFMVHNAKGVYTSCSVEGTRMFGFIASGRSEPQVNGLHVRPVLNRGIEVRTGANGVFENCSVSGGVAEVKTSAVKVSDGGQPRFRGLSIDGYDGEGLEISKDTGGEYTQVVVTDLTKAAVSVRDGATPIIKDLTVRRAGAPGHSAVTIWGGTPRLEDVTISETPGTALYAGGGTVEVRGLQVDRAGGTDEAVRVVEGCTLRVVEGEINGPARFGVGVVNGRFIAERLTVTGCETGVTALPDGVVELQVCRLTGNEIGLSAGGRRPVRLIGCAVEGNTQDLEIDADAPEPELTDHTGPVPGRLAVAADDEPVAGVAGGPAATAPPPLNEALSALDGLIGLDRVKAEIRKLVDFARLRAVMRERGMRELPFNRHLIFVGPPGTGKTEVAQRYADIAAALGLVAEPKVVKVDRGSLVAKHIGHTEDNMRKAIDRARGGVLFIDEVYQLVEGGEADFGRQAVDVLLARMEELRDELVVIVAGYAKEMDRFLNFNPGLRSRFTTTITFPNYTPAELVEIVGRFAAEAGFRLPADTRQALNRHFAAVPADTSFGNARHARTVFDAMVIELAGRISETEEIDLLLPSDAEGALRRTGLGVGAGVEDPRRAGELLASLDAMIGLDAVKGEIREVVAELRMARRLRRMGRTVAETSRHLAFLGPPGTGKTAVARLYGQLLAALGMLPEGQFVEATARDLVAGYVGQTAGRTRERFREAVGGVLFIDEAYALTPRRDGGHDFNSEAVAALLTEMENHRHDTVVIVAGYPAEMDRFLTANPGLDSRFSRRIAFPHYSVEELVEIFLLQTRAAEYDCPDDTVEAVRRRIATEPRGESFGNGRFVRNLFESARRRLAVRLVDQDVPDAELTTLHPEDFTP
ncbi:AAA family ATPase [Rhizohabitans arisaemae]|uniref:AAA family ATPase n=1 Tax=Rhizohabitans arisaemae TaxID=2720610 RepID=UPI0024B1A267|nr:AAA family ATPase [Rhizohabitans arisaemae]